MLTLYDFAISGNGYKVRSTLVELGLEYRYVEVDVLGGATRQAWFRAKNPFGQIPVLELDDGTCLAESTAICCFLAAGTPLLPDEPVQRARILAWMCFEQTHVDGVISRARFRRRYPDVIPTRPEEFEQWWAEGHRALAVLEERLAKQPWLAADHFTLADVALYAYVHCAPEGGFNLAGYPAVRSWLERVRSRPGHVPIDAAGGVSSAHVL